MIHILFFAKKQEAKRRRDHCETISNIFSGGGPLLLISSMAIFYAQTDAPMKRANAVCPVTAVENNYNIINRAHEDLVPFLEAYHIGWVAYGSMLKGLLSGTFQKGVQFARDDWRSRLVNDENLDRYQALLAYLSDLGKEKGATSGQIALAWVLQRKPYIVPIPGMRSVERLTENAKAEEITLTANEMKKVDELSLIE